MADATRNVDININVKGVRSDFTVLIDGFNTLKTSVTSVQETLTGLKSFLTGFTAPAGLSELTKSLQDLSSIKKATGLESVVKAVKDISTIGTIPDISKFVSSLQAFAGIGKLPNLKNIASGFETFSKMTNVPNLSKFAEEIKKFQDIKLPNLTKISDGFKGLADTSISMVEVGKRLRILHRNLKSFTDVKVPNLDKFVQALRNLILINTQTSASQIRALSSALLEFPKDIRISWVNTFVAALRDLIKLDSLTIASQLRALASALKDFPKDLNLTWVRTFVTSLKELLKLNTQTIASQLRALASALREFPRDLNLTWVRAFASGLRELLLTNTQTIASQLRSLASALRDFPKDLSLTWVRSFVESLKELIKVNTQTIASQLRALASALLEFPKDLSLSWIKTFVTSLRELILINTLTIASQLRALASALKEFPKDINLTWIKSFVTSLRELLKLNTQTIASQLRALASALREFPKDLNLTWIKKFTEGLRDLLLLNTQTIASQLRGLASALREFPKDINATWIRTFVAALRDLILLNTLTIASQLRALASALRDFPKDLNLSWIKTFAAGLRELILINTQTSASQLRALASALVNFPKSLNMGWMKSFALGLKELIILDTQKAANSLSKLSTVLNQFSDRKMPGMASFVKGLQQLIALDIQAVVDRIRQLAGAINELNKGGFLKGFATFASDLNRVSTALNGTNASVLRSRTSLNALGSEVGSLSDRLRTFGDRLRNYFSYRIVADFTMGLQNAMRTGVTAIGDYDQALKDLQAITGATSIEVEQMGTVIKQVASNTKFSASEIAQGMRTLGQAGLSAAESIDSIGAVANLATGTLSDMATTVDLVTTAMRVFGLESSKAADISDIFANAVNRSKLTIDKLKTSMNYVGPVAASAGISLEETSAAMMTLANSGLRASTIGTSLRMMLSELIDPSKKFREAAERVGVSLESLDPSTNSLKDVITNLGLVITDAGVAFDVFGKRGANAALSLTSADSQFNSLLDTVSKTGTASKMAEKQIEGLGVAFKNLMDKLELLAISFGEAGIIGVFKLLIDISRKIVDAVTALVNSGFGKLVIQSGLVTTAIIALLGTLGLLSMAFKTLMSTQFVGWLAKLSAGIITATQSVGLFGGTASAASVGAYSLSTAVRAVSVSFTALWTALWPILAVGAVIGAIALAFKGLGWAVDQLTTSAQTSSDDAKKLADEYSRAEKAVTDYKVAMVGLEPTSTAALELNKKLREELLEVAKGESELADEALKAATSISGLTGKLYDGTKSIDAYRAEAQRLKDVKLNESFNKAFDGLQQQFGVVQRTLDGIKDLFKNFINDVKGFFIDFDLSKLMKLGNYINPFTGIGQFAKDTVENIKETFGSVNETLNFTKALEAGKKSWKEYADYVDELMLIQEDQRTTREQNLIDAFNKGTEEAIGIMDRLAKAGYEAANMTSEEMINAAQSMGLLQDASEQALEAVKYTMDNINKGSGSGLINKWREDLKKVPTDINKIVEAAKEVGLEFSDVHMQQMRDSAEYQARKREEMSATIAEIDRLNKAFNAELAQEKNFDKQKEISLKYTELLRIENEKALNIEREYALNKTALQKELSDAATRTYQEDMEKLAANTEGNVKAFAIGALAIQEKYKNTLKGILEGSLDSQKILADTEETLKRREDLLKKHLYDIDLLEAKGVLTKEQAEAKKTQSTIESYASQYKAAQEAYDKIRELKRNDPLTSQDDVDAANQLMLEKEEEFLEKMREYNLEYTRDIQEAREGLNEKLEEIAEEAIENEENIAEAGKKAADDRGKADKEYAENRKKIETDLSDKIQDINEKTQEKLKDLARERIDVEKSAIDTIKGLHDTLADKIANLRQRGMTDEQKEADNRYRANQKLIEGINAVEEARKTGDQAALDRGQRLLDQAGSMYEGLEDTSAAESGIRRVYDALENTTKVQLALDQAAIDEEIRLEKEARDKAIKAEEEASAIKLGLLTTEYNEKVKGIKDALAEALKAEQTRHNKVMTNINKEIAEYTRLMAAAQEKLDNLKNVTPVNEDKGASSYAGGPSTDGNSGTASSYTDVYNQIDKGAKKAEASVDDLAASMQIVRREGETDVSLALRVSNSKEVNQAIAEFKNTAKQQLSQDPLQVQADVDTAEATAKVKALTKEFYDLYKVESTPSGGTALVRTAEDAQVAKDKLAEISKEFDIIGSSSGDQNLQDKVNFLNAMSDSGVKATDAANNLVKELEGISNRTLSFDFSEGYSIIDDLGNKVQGVKENFQSNPIVIGAELGVSGFDTLRSLEKIKGLTDSFRSATAAQVKLEVEPGPEEDLKEIERHIELLDAKEAEIKATINDGEMNSDLNRIENIRSKLEARAIEIKAIINDRDLNVDLARVRGVRAELEAKAIEIRTTLEEGETTEQLTDIENILEELNKRETEIQIEIDKHVLEDVSEIQDEVNTLADNSAEIPLDADASKFETEIESLESKLPQDLKAKLGLDTKELDKEFSLLKSETSNYEIPVAFAPGITRSPWVPLTDGIATIKKDFERISEVSIEVSIHIDSSEIDALIEAISEFDSDIVVTVTTVDRSSSLAHMREMYDALVSKTIAISLDVRGTNKWEQLLKTYNALKDKKVTITQYVKTVEKRAAGGLIGVQRFAEGGFARLQGALSGFGGGDRIKALLEAGEFIMNKFAVKKYGEDFMRSINNGTLDISNIIRASTGGLITSSGVSGGITKNSSVSNANVFNLDFSFSGDVSQPSRQNARAMATMVMSELEKMHRGRS